MSVVYDMFVRIISSEDEILVQAYEGALGGLRSLDGYWRRQLLAYLQRTESANKTASKKAVELCTSAVNSSIVDMLKKGMLHVGAMVVRNKYRTVGILVVGFVAYKTWQYARLPVYNWLQYKTGRNVNQGFRMMFNQEFVYRQMNLREAHSHPVAASLRTGAETSIDDFITLQGFRPYSVSTSSRDRFDGQRFYYHPKDLGLDYKNDQVSKDHVIKMIDVDYYADLPQWLWKGRPIVLYTFVPQRVGGTCTEGYYTITDDIVTVVHNGGGSFSHPLWDYGIDHFVIKGKLWSLLVHVDSIKIPNDPDRRIVCLTPVHWYLSVFNGLLDYAEPLERRKITYGKANVMVVHLNTEEGNEVYVSVGTSGNPVGANVKLSAITSLAIRLREAKHPSIGEIERYIRFSDKVADSSVVAPIIYDALMNGWELDGSKRAVLDSGIARIKPSGYQCSGPLLFEDGQEVGVQVWEPIITGCGFFPRKSYNNDVQTIAGRVTSQRNTVDPNTYYYKYRSEFLNYFKPNQVIPMSIDEVIEKQNKPLQRMRCEMTKNWLFAAAELFKIKAFMKPESYPKISDPRNISTCPPDHTMRLSAYTYAAKKRILTRLPWFLPGSTPVEIVDKVQRLVRDKPYVLSSDYSRLDGTISPFLRSVEYGFYKRVFRKEYALELTQLMSNEIRAPATTAFGVSYNTGSSRLSGSPLTTDGNTLIVGFVAYCAARKANLIGEGEVDKIPTLVYGDDKLAVDIPESVMCTTAKDLGLTLKCDQASIGEPVTFLARKFVDPWSSRTTMQDPKRALGKFHLSVVKNLDKRIVMRNKAMGYMVTDPLTPVISNACRRVITELPSITDAVVEGYRRELTRDMNYWYMEFGRENGAWPQEESAIPLMRTIVAQDLDITEHELDILCAGLDAGEWEPIKFEPTITVEALHEGELVTPPATNGNCNPKTPREKPNNKTKKPSARRDFTQHLGHSEYGFLQAEEVTPTPSESNFGPRSGPSTSGIPPKDLKQTN